MKKFFISLFVLLLVLGAVFYQEIKATVDFYTYQHNNPEIFTKATINWERLSFSSADYSTSNITPLKIHSLQILTPFVVIKRQEDTDFVRAINSSKSITVSTTDTPPDFFEVNNFSTLEKSSACKFLSKTSSLAACSNNYNLYRAFLELNKSDIHLFTSITEKDLYLKLIEIRSKELAGNTVSAFETKHTRGFLFTLDHQNYTAEIFDKNDQRYKLTFSGLDKAEIAFTLSNIYPNI